MAIVWTEENALQERTNTFTHGLGFALSIPAAIVLILAGLDKSWWIATACSIYVLTLSLMYLFSALSHGVKEPRLRNRVRSLDQGFVYTLIAGTFTPFICAFLNGWLCFVMLALVWGAAGAGFYSKVFSKHRINNMASLTYLLLGWVPALILFGYVPAGCFAMMAAGGVIYSLGVWFLQNDHRSDYHHAIWHIAVIVASAWHYAAIWFYTV